MKLALYLMMTIGTIKNGYSTNSSNGNAVSPVVQPIDIADTAAVAQSLKQIFSAISNKQNLIDLSRLLKKQAAISNNLNDTPALYRIYDLTIGTVVSLSEILSALNDQLCQPNNQPINDTISNDGSTINNNIPVTGTETTSDNGSITNNNTPVIEPGPNFTNGATTTNGSNASSSLAIANGITVNNNVVINHILSSNRKSSAPVVNPPVANPPINNFPVTSPPLNDTQNNNVSDIYEYNVVNGYLVVTLNGKVVKVLEFPKDNTNTITNTASVTTTNNTNITTNNGTATPTFPPIVSTPPNIPAVTTPNINPPAVATTNSYQYTSNATNFNLNSSSSITNTRKYDMVTSNDTNPNYGPVSNFNGGSVYEFNGKGVNNSSFGGYVGGINFVAKANASSNPVDC